MRYSAYTSWVCLVGVSILFNCGCGSEGYKKRPPMGKVHGTVTYKGEPVANAMVAFMLDGAPRGSTGETDENGAFQLTTYNSNDGAFVGTNTVTVTQKMATFGDKPASEMTGEDLIKIGTLKPPKGTVIPAKYADHKKTPQKNTVELGKNEFEIELLD